MLTNSMIGMVRRRWRSERPFQGHLKDSLVRKINNPATREDVKAMALRELELRERDLRTL